jgi:hypothetical protein
MLSPPLGRQLSRHNTLLPASLYIHVDMRITAVYVAH